MMLTDGIHTISGLQFVVSRRQKTITHKHTSKNTQRITWFDKLPTSTGGEFHYILNKELHTL